MITAFSCQERNILSNVVWEQENTPSSASRYHSLLCIYHVVFLYIQFCTLISTSSKTMQPISLTPAPTRTFAEIETLGPICSKKQLRKFTRKSGEGKRGAGGGVGEMWKDRKFKVVKDRKFLGCSLVKEVLIFSIGHLKNLCAWCTCKCLSKVKLARMLDNFEGHDSIFFALHWNPSFKISCVRHNYVSNINLFDPPLISSKLRVYQVCSNHPRTFTPNVFKLLGFTC